MPLYMLDTDISSYAMKRSHPKVLERLGETKIADVCILGRDEGGVALWGSDVSNSARDGTALTEYLRYVEVMDFLDAAAVHYAEIRADFKNMGHDDWGKRSLDCRSCPFAWHRVGDDQGAGVRAGAGT